MDAYTRYCQRARVMTELERDMLRARSYRDGQTFDALVRSLHRYIDNGRGRAELIAIIDDLRSPARV
jgi:hypothetical protein